MLFIHIHFSIRTIPCTAEAPENMPMLKTAYFVFQNGQARPGLGRRRRKDAPAWPAPSQPTCPGMKYPVPGNPSLRFVHPSLYKQTSVKPKSKTILHTIL